MIRDTDERIRKKNITKSLENVKEGFELDSCMRITVNVTSNEEFVDYKRALEAEGYSVQGEGNFGENPSCNDLWLTVTKLQNKYNPNQ